jgi:hypothetical protein
MDIIGRIHFQNKVFVNKQECYGVVKANDNKFKILIAKCAGASYEQFAETMFHELTHLAFFIIMALTDTRLSEKAQHRVIKKLTPIFLWGLDEERNKNH